MKRSNLDQSDGSDLLSGFHYFSRVIALTSIGVGTLVLIGWIARVEILTTFVQHSSSVKVNGALSFVFLGISLFLLQEPGKKSPAVRNAAKLLAALAGIIGAVTLAEYFFDWNSGIDQFFFREPPGAIGTSHPGRISPNAALVFVLLSISLLLLDKETRSGKRPSQVLSSIAALIGWLAAVGYAFGVSSLYRVASYTQMAPSAAVAAFFLSLAIMVARPNAGFMKVASSNQAGGILVRRLIPVAVLLIPLLGWFRLVGERAGLFDRDMGVTLLVTVNVILLTCFIYAIGKSLNRTEVARGEVEEKLIESDRRFRATFDQADVGIAHVSPEGRWLLVNQKLCDIVGYTQEELRQKTFQDITHPDDLQADLDYVERMLLGKINAYSMEKRYFRKDGSVTWINLAVSLIRDLQGTPKYFISVIDEINDRKEAEHQILRLNAELEHRVAERTHELEEANEDLRKSEERYRTIFEESKDAIFISTSNGNFLDINPAGLELSDIPQNKNFWG